MRRSTLALSFAVCFVVVFSVLSLAVQVQIEGVPATATPGDSFTATVAISDVADLNAAVFEIVFDNTVLEFDSASVTDGLIGGTAVPLFAVVKIEDGRWRVTQDVVGLNGASGSGYLCEAGFTVIGSGGDSSDIDLQNESLSDTEGHSIIADWQGAHVDIDTTPPTVTVKLPIGSDVAIDSDISATFSEPMNTASAESAFSLSPTVSGSLSWLDNTMTFNPTASLDYATQYTVTIAGTAADLAGNGLDGDEDGTAEGSPTDDYSWSFTTVAAVPDISVSPTSKDFGNVTVDTSSSPETFTVTNDGTADLHVGTMSITGVDASQFSIQNDTCSTQTIAPGNSATLEVVFSPSSTGAKAATLNIPSDDPDEATVTVSLSGAGVLETAAVFRVDGEGNVLADQAFYGASFQTGAADVAEWVQVSEPVEPGDVLELDPENPQHYRKSTGSCSSLVAGVVSTQPGVLLGSLPPPHSSPFTHDSDAQALLALIGIVPVKVCNEGGTIGIGDLLVSSSIPGFARKWDAESEGACHLIGKALEEMNELMGTILVLLMR